MKISAKPCSAWNRQYLPILYTIFLINWKSFKIGHFREKKASTGLKYVQNWNPRPKKPPIRHPKHQNRPIITNFLHNFFYINWEPFKMGRFFGEKATIGLKYGRNRNPRPKKTLVRHPEHQNRPIFNDFRGYRASLKFFEIFIYLSLKLA